MTQTTEPVSVDAEQYIARLRTQMAEAWGQTQAELALAREENTARAAREADKDRRIAELESTIAELRGASTRP
ncbi:hypothetical protein [Kitasatospora sp. NBC_01300]|uniref:hypothetical protein n=1 Tax=Kitasatospora sp. NBC_01300 TaxID=2903574 RepID=UPI00352E9086|nr:hypothetical protein OG556_16255 [Kitasatospora sp. NBC_01300]